MVSKLGPLGTGIYWLEPSYGVKASIIPPDHSFAARQKRTSWLPAPLLSFGAMGWRMLMLLAAAPAAAFMPAAAPATSAAPRPLHAPRKLSRASIEDGRSSVPMLRGGGDDAKAARAYRAVAGFLDRRYFLVGAASAVAMAAIAPTIGCTGGLLDQLTPSIKRPSTNASMARVPWQVSSGPSSPSIGEQRAVSSSCLA